MKLDKLIHKSPLDQIFIDGWFQLYVYLNPKYAEPWVAGRYCLKCRKPIDRGEPTLITVNQHHIHQICYDMIKLQNALENG